MTSLRTQNAIKGEKAPALVGTTFFGKIGSAAVFCKWLVGSEENQWIGQLFSTCTDSSPTCLLTV